MSWNEPLLHSVAGGAAIAASGCDSRKADLCEEVEAHSAQAKAHAQDEGRELKGCCLF